MAASDQPTQSILDANAHTTTGASPRLTQTKATERYTLGDEIARGGMGIVYRATDTVLGREVAVKVLQDKYGPESWVAVRFFGEALITGQLQHPSIPPVHDLGTLPDGRPFLAMKLIKGQTLEVLLKARTSAATDRGQFVAVYEQICQAVAYAHTHNVIHRDLKPANVMVGAFGETQVMDWGLAKVLGAEPTGATPTELASEATRAWTEITPTRDLEMYTQAGSMLGTPAFAPPEQVLGEIDKVDARADVFGLGAILAVLLTGKPPYVGETAESVRVLAARGKLDDCFARLDASGAEPELVALCKRCLSFEPADRPADGGAVAKAVAALRAAADERARRAELEKATAEARLAEQRKRRKVQFALVGLCFLGVLGVVAGGFWYQAQRHQHERELTATQERTRAEAQAQTRAAELVKSLSSSDTAFVPRIVEELTNYRTEAEPALAEMLANAKPESKDRLHASLALLAVDPGQVPYLYGRLLDAHPQEVRVIRKALVAHKDELLDKLWAEAEKKEPGQAMHRLRAAAALALYDPESAKWATVQTAVADDLVGEPAVYLSNWLETLRPVRLKLLAPLSMVYADSKRRETQRSLASDILADYAIDQAPVLANLVMNSDPQRFAVFLPMLKVRGEEGLPALIAEIDKKLPADVPSSDPEREKLGKRQANAAAALLKMNQPAKAWQVFQHSADPRARSYLIHWLSALGVSAKAIAQRLDAEPDESIRRALLLSLGEFSEKEFSADERKLLLPKLQDLYRTDADPGLHAACEWLLRTWKEEAWLKQLNEEWAKDQDQRQKRLEAIQQRVKKEQEKTSRQWYVNGQGQTFVVIPGPVTFPMGSPPSEVGRQDVEPQHQKRVGRTFAIAAKSVTLAEYRRFDPYYSGIEKWARTPDSPVLGTNWFQAAEYCNWLSKQEGLRESEWCYEPRVDPRAKPTLAASTVGFLLGTPGARGSLLAMCGSYPGRTDPEYAGGMKPAANYLRRTGYRLPTEAEMEYATRASAVTSRYYGETEELLSNYAWYEKNGNVRSWPVGKKKPNDFGFFDVHGNVWTWCQERFKDYSREIGVSEDREDVVVITSTVSRVLRGGSFINNALFVRSAGRTNVAPATRFSLYGFRPARTLPLDGLTALPLTGAAGETQK